MILNSSHTGPKGGTQPIVDTPADRKVLYKILEAHPVGSSQVFDQNISDRHQWKTCLTHWYDSRSFSSVPFREPGSPEGLSVSPFVTRPHLFHGLASHHEDEPSLLGIKGGLPHFPSSVAE